MTATVAGTLTGMTETLMHTPFEVVKCRLQSKEHLHERNSWTCARHIWKLYGTLGFYRGFEAYLLRQAAWNGSFFGLIGLIREHFPFPPSNTNLTPAPSRSLLHENKMAYDFLTGLVAGSIATIVSSPIDLVKTRLQIASGKVPWFFPSLGNIYRQEGFIACFRGLNVRLARTAPGSGILLVGFEAVNRFLREHFELKQGG